MSLYVKDKWFWYLWQVFSFMSLSLSRITVYCQSCLFAGVSRLACWPLVAAGRLCSSWWGGPSKTQLPAWPCTWPQSPLPTQPLPALGSPYATPRDLGGWHKNTKTSPSVLSPSHLGSETVIHKAKYFISIWGYYVWMLLTHSLSSVQSIHVCQQFLNINDKYLQTRVQLPHHLNDKITNKWFLQSI